MSGLFDQITNYSPPLLTAGQVNYKGTWSAAANTPTLVSPPAATTKGDYYVVSAAGTQFTISFAVGDWIISNGTAWEKVDLTDAVSSVFGRTGAVVGASTDYSSVGLTNTAIGASSPSTGAFTTVTASSTIAATGAVTGSNLSGTHSGTSSGTNTGDQTITLTGGVTGSGTGSFAATVVTNANLTGDVTSVGNATTLTNAPVIAKVLTGYVSGAGTVAATDSILQAIQKLNGNDATNANLTGAITSVGNATSLGSFSSANLSAALTDETGSGAAVFATSPTLVTPALGTPSALVGTNITGTATAFNINGTVGATTRNTVAATTISATSTVTATADNIKAFVGTTGAGTGFAYGTYETNGGAQYGRVGIEGSSGGTLLSGTGAYDFIVGSISGSTWIGAGGAGIAKISGTGLAVTGALSATGPSFTLAATGNDSYINFQNSSVTQGQIECYAGDMFYQTQTAGKNHIFRTDAGTVRATISSTGLAVTGSGYFSAGAYFMNTGTWGTGNWEGLRILQNAGSAYAIQSNAGGTGTTRDVYIATGSDYFFYGKASNGYVGIGTSSPAQKLEVTDNSSISYSGTGRRVGSFLATAAAVADRPGISLGYDTAGAGIIAADTQSTGQPIAFWTYNGSTWGERARISKEGNVGIGTTSPVNSLHVITASGSYVARLGVNGTGSQNFINFVIGENGTPTGVGSVTYNGTTTLFNSTSDYRLKDVTGPLTDSGAFIDALKPKVGTWKSNGDKFVGFIAHEFAEVSPSSVSGEKDAVGSDGKPIYQAMQASSPEVIANLVAEIQELRKRMAAVEGK